MPTAMLERAASKDVYEAGASFTQQLILTPSVKASMVAEAPGLSQKVKIFESPLEELPPISNFVNLNQQLMAYTQIYMKNPARISRLSKSGVRLCTVWHNWRKT